MELTVFLEPSNSFSVLKLCRRYACRFFIDVSSTASVKIRTASFARHKYRNRTQTANHLVRRVDEGSVKKECLEASWNFLVRTSSSRRHWRLCELTSSEEELTATCTHLSPSSTSPNWRCTRPSRGRKSD